MPIVPVVVVVAVRVVEMRVVVEEVVRVALKNVDYVGRERSVRSYGRERSRKYEEKSLMRKQVPRV